MSNALNRMNDYQNNVFDNASQGFGDPNEPKCCFIFPLRWGIIAIGIMILMDMGTQYGMVMKMNDVS